MALQKKIRVIKIFKLLIENCDMVVLSNFHPKQANELIGDPRGSIIELFIAILT